MPARTSPSRSPRSGTSGLPVAHTSTDSTAAVPANRSDRITKGGSPSRSAAPKITTPEKRNAIATVRPAPVGSSRRVRARRVSMVASSLLISPSGTPRQERADAIDEHGDRGDQLLLARQQDQIRVRQQIGDRS